MFPTFSSYVAYIFLNRNPQSSSVYYINQLFEQLVEHGMIFNAGESIVGDTVVEF